MDQRKIVELGVSELASAILRERGLDSSVSHDALLLNAGLSSLDLVNLLIGVELRFDVHIPDDEIDLENLGTIDAIAKMVVKFASTNIGDPAR